MSEKDFVVPELKVERQNCTFKMDELVQVMKEWASLNRYNISEGYYSQKDEDGNKEVTIDWAVNREIDDYTKLQIKVKFKMSGKNVVVKKKGMSVKGNIAVTVEGILITDKDSKWEKQPGLKFLRDIYDTTFKKSKMDMYREKLNNECNDFYIEVKSFLDLHMKG